MSFLDVTAMFTANPIDLLNDEETGRLIFATHIFEVTARTSIKNRSVVLAFVRDSKTTELYFCLCFVVKEERGWRRVLMNAPRSLKDIRAGTMMVWEEEKNAFSEDFILALARFGLTREQYVALVEECSTQIP